MDSFKPVEQNLLDIVREAIKHPDMLGIDFGLSGRVLIDHVIGRFEQAIDNYGKTEGCPQIIRDGYASLKKLYPLHFRNSNYIEKPLENNQSFADLN